MAFKEGDNKLRLDSKVNSEKETNLANVYKKLEHVLNNKSELFSNKVDSLIQVWNQVGQCHLTDQRESVGPLMDWLKLHTLNIVLTGDWKKYKNLFEEKLLQEVKGCEILLVSSNSIYSSRCRKLAEVIKDPWGNPILNTLLNNPNTIVGSKEIEFFAMETGYLISTRVRKLCESHCEDMALNLVSAFMQCQEQMEGQPVNLNTTEDQKRFILDVYIALLYKYKKTEQIVAKLKSLSLMEGFELLKRFAHKRVNISKIWRHSNHIAQLAARVFVTAAVVEPPEESANILKTLLYSWFSLNDDTDDLNSLMSVLRKIIVVACSSVHLYIFCEVVHKKFGSKLKTFTIELYIRALTTSMNERERLKNENDNTKFTTSTQQLANGFLQLADILQDHVKVSRECVLTAFSLQPTQETLDKIIQLAELSGYQVLDTGQDWKCKLHPPAKPTDELCWKCDKCGDYMSKPEMVDILTTNTALSEALSAEHLGLSSHLCDDLVVVLSSPRYQLFNWLIRWPQLYKLCILYLRDPEGTINRVTELRFLDIDYNMFSGIKREPEEEFLGIERGYEQFLEEELLRYLNHSSSSKDSLSKSKAANASRNENLKEQHIKSAPLMPTAKSDPNVLKNLRSFRPSLKRPKHSHTDREVSSKVFITSASTPAMPKPADFTVAQNKQACELFTNSVIQHNYLQAQMLQQQLSSANVVPMQRHANITNLYEYSYGHSNALNNDHNSKFNKLLKSKQSPTSKKNFGLSTTQSKTFVHPRMEPAKHSYEVALELSNRLKNTDHLLPAYRNSAFFSTQTTSTIVHPVAQPPTNVNALASSINTNFLSSSGGNTSVPSFQADSTVAQYAFNQSRNIQMQRNLATERLEVPRLSESSNLDNPASLEPALLFNTFANLCLQQANLNSRFINIQNGTPSLSSFKEPTKKATKERYTPKSTTKLISDNSYNVSDVCNQQSNAFHHSENLYTASQHLSESSTHSTIASNLSVGNLGNYKIRKGAESSIESNVNLNCHNLVYNSKNILDKSQLRKEIGLDTYRIPPSLDITLRTTSNMAFDTNSSHKLKNSLQKCKKDLHGIESSEFIEKTTEVSKAALHSNYYNLQGTQENGGLLLEKTKKGLALTKVQHKQHVTKKPSKLNDTEIVQDLIGLSNLTNQSCNENSQVPVKSLNSLQNAELLNKHTNIKNVNDAGCVEKPESSEQLILDKYENVDDFEKYSDSSISSSCAIRDAAIDHSVTNNERITLKNTSKICNSDVIDMQILHKNLYSDSTQIIDFLNVRPISTSNCLSSTNTVDSSNYRSNYNNDKLWPQSHSDKLKRSYTKACCNCSSIKNNDSIYGDSLTNPSTIKWSCTCNNKMASKNKLVNNNKIKTNSQSLQDLSTDTLNKSADMVHLASDNYKSSERSCTKDITKADIQVLSKPGSVVSNESIHEVDFSSRRLMGNLNASSSLSQIKTCRSINPIQTSHINVITKSQESTYNLKNLLSSPIVERANTCIPTGIADLLSDSEEKSNSSQNLIDLKSNFGVLRNQPVVPYKTNDGENRLSTSNNGVLADVVDLSIHNTTFGDKIECLGLSRSVRAKPNCQNLLVASTNRFPEEICRSLQFSHTNMFSKSAIVFDLSSDSDEKSVDDKNLKPNVNLLHKSLLNEETINCQTASSVKKESEVFKDLPTISYKTTTTDNVLSTSNSDISTTITDLSTYVMDLSKHDVTFCDKKPCLTSVFTEKTCKSAQHLDTTMSIFVKQLLNDSYMTAEKMQRLDLGFQKAFYGMCEAFNDSSGSYFEEVVFYALLNIDKKIMKPPMVHDWLILLVQTLNILSLNGSQLTPTLLDKLTLIVEKKYSMQHNTIMQHQTAVSTNLSTNLNEIAITENTDMGAFKESTSEILSSTEYTNEEMGTCNSLSTPKANKLNRSGLATNLKKCDELSEICENLQESDKCIGNKTSIIGHCFSNTFEESEVYSDNELDDSKYFRGFPACSNAIQETNNTIYSQRYLLDHFSINGSTDSKSKTNKKHKKSKKSQIDGFKQSNRMLSKMHLKNVLDSAVERTADSQSGTYNSSESLETIGHSFVSLDKTHKYEKSQMSTLKSSSKRIPKLRIKKLSETNTLYESSKTFERSFVSSDKIHKKSSKLSKKMISKSGVKIVSGSDINETADSESKTFGHAFVSSDKIHKKYEESQKNAFKSSNKMVSKSSVKKVLDSDIDDTTAGSESDTNTLKESLESVKHSFISSQMNVLKLPKKTVSTSRAKYLLGSDIDDTTADSDSETNGFDEPFRGFERSVDSSGKTLYKYGKSQINVLEQPKKMVSKYRIGNLLDSDIDETTGDSEFGANSLNVSIETFAPSTASSNKTQNKYEKLQMDRLKPSNKTAYKYHCRGVSFDYSDIDETTAESEEDMLTESADFSESQLPSTSYCTYNPNVSGLVRNGQQSVESHYLQNQSLNRNTELGTSYSSAVCSTISRYPKDCDRELLKKYKIKEARVILHRLSVNESFQKKIIKPASKFLKPSLPTRKQPMRDLKGLLERSENKAKNRQKRMSNATANPKIGLKSWPLKDVNPKVSRQKEVKVKTFKEEERCKNESEADILSYMNPRVVLNRLELDKDKEKKRATEVLSNVPGLNDLQLIRPSSVDRIVQVVQVSNTRTTTSIPIQSTQTSTQVTPHIQRIGQPRTEKPESNIPNSTSVSSSVTVPTASIPITTSESPTLINILSQHTICPSNQVNCVGVRPRSSPVINILSQQIIKPANNQPPAKMSNNNTSNEVQVNSIPRVISGGDQIFSQLINPVRTPTPTLKSLVSAPPSDQNRIVQFLCKSADGKLIPVTSFTSNKVVKVAMTQNVNLQLPINANVDEKASKTDNLENSDTLPKFQQAFGKSAYQNNVDSPEPANSTNDTANSDIEKSNSTIKEQPKNVNTSLNVQPVQGGVIYTRQMPVGQTINLIPPGRGQVFRIATTNPEQLSLVKETVIQGKMNALLAAALQGKPRPTDNEVDIANDENSQATTRIALATHSTLVQNARIVKPVLQIPSNVIRSTPQSNLSSTTLEQLREFDMVYKQVKERSSTNIPAESSPQSDSNEANQPQISVTYLNQGQKIDCSPVVVVSSYCTVQPAASPALSVTSQGSSSPCVTPAPTLSLTKTVTKNSKVKSVKSATSHTSKASPIPKPQQKPQEDEHTTQRIFDILAEYAEQLRNSPDLNNKPAPRRRSNPPTNPSQNAKRKKSSSNKKSGHGSNSLASDGDIEDTHTIGSEDSSSGVVQISLQEEEQALASIMPDSNEDTESSNQLILTESNTTQSRSLIIADSNVGEALKVSSTAVLVPGNYIMPVSMVKGGQQIAVVSGGSKILATVPTRSGPNMLLFQSFLNQTRKPGVSTVKYSTVQPISSITRNISVGTAAQTPSVTTTTHNVTAVTLGQAVAIQKVNQLDRRDVNNFDTEVLLTITSTSENKSTSTELSEPKQKEMAKINENSQNIQVDCLPKKLLNLEEKACATTSVVTSVIAQSVSTKQATLEERPAAQTIMNLNLNSSNNNKDTSIKVEGRVQSVLVATCTSNGPMLSHSPPVYNKQSNSTNPISESNKDEYLRNEGKQTNNEKLFVYGKKKRNSHKHDLHQLSLQRKQAAMERELRLQKSLSEECEDLGVDEPSTSDLFPEADLLFDSNHSPSFDQCSQDIKRATNHQEVKEAPKPMGLFCDDEPIKTDLLFEPIEFQASSELDYNRTNDVTNGQDSATSESGYSTGNNIVLQTSTSMSDVTIPSPISPDPYNDNLSPFVTKCKYKYSNRKKLDKPKPVENWSVEFTNSEDTTGNTEIAKHCNHNTEVHHVGRHHRNSNCCNEGGGEIMSFRIVERMPLKEEECDGILCEGDIDCHSAKGTRRSLRKLCSCCNGSIKTRKRPASRPPTPYSHKKTAIAKKR